MKELPVSVPFHMTSTMMAGQSCPSSAGKDTGLGGTKSELSLVPSTFLSRPLIMVFLPPGLCSDDSEFLLIFLGRHKAKIYQEKEEHEPHHSHSFPQHILLLPVQEHLENPWHVLCPPTGEPEKPHTAWSLCSFCSSNSVNKAGGKYIFFNFLDDITCILNNNEPINYKKQNNQKNMYVKFGVFIN